MEKLIMIAFICGLLPALLMAMAKKGTGNLFALLIVKTSAIAYLLLATIYLLKQLNII